MIEKYYTIHAKDPLPSWNEIYTESQLIAKFWDYAEQEWGDKDLGEYKEDKFTLEFIQDFWSVTFIPFADELVERAVEATEYFPTLAVEEILEYVADCPDDFADYTPHELGYVVYYRDEEKEID